MEKILSNGLIINISEKNYNEDTYKFYFKDFQLKKINNIDKNKMFTYIFINNNFTKKENLYKSYMPTKYKSYIDKKIVIEKDIEHTKDKSLLLTKNIIDIDDEIFFEENFIKETMFYILKYFALIKNTISIKGNKIFLIKLQRALLHYKINSYRNKKGLFIKEPQSVMKCLQFDKNNELKYLKKTCANLEKKYLFVAHNEIYFKLKEKDN